MKHYLQNNSNNGIRKLVQQYELCKPKDRFKKFKEKDFIAIAQHYNQERFLQEAIHTINQGIATYPKSQILKVQQIRLLIDQNHPSLALALLQQADNEVLTAIDLDLLAVESMIRSKKYEAALSKLNGMKRKYQLPKDRSDIFVLEGLIYEKLNQFDMVFRSINEALHYNPSHEGALTRMLFFVDFTRKHKESIRFHQQLLKKEHYSALTWYNLGISLYHEFMYEEAIEAFEFAFIIDSDLDPAYYYCAEVYMLQGIYSKAIEIYDQMLNRFHVTKPEVYINLAECHIKTGNSNLAIGYLKFASILDEDAQISFLMAEAYKNLKKFDKAFDHYFEALKIDDTREDIHIQLAVLYFEKCDFESAEYHFDQAVNLAPYSSEHWVSYASLFINIGEIKKAENILKEGIEYNYDAKLLFCQAACQILLGKRKAGITLMDEALNLDINQQDVIFIFAGELREDESVQAILKYYNRE